MAKEFITGLMEGDMMVNINKIRNMGLVLIIGQMVKHMKATGKTVSNMEKPNSQTQKVEAN